MDKTVTCVDVYGKSFEILVSELQWRPSAYGIVVKDNKLLLSKQLGGYDLPGGGVDLGETLEDGVIREIKEETGLDVIDPKPAGIASNFFQSTHADNRSYQSILIYFVCTLIGGTLSTDGFDEHEKGYAELAEWIPLNDLDDIKIASTVDFRPHLRKALDNLTQD